MPIIKSAKKRVRVAAKATVRNSKTKRNLKNALKAFKAAALPKKADAHSSAQSAIDTAVKKGLMHKNKAARKKRQLAAAARAAGVKSGIKKTVAAKPTVKKAAPKKTAAKKPVAKKTTKKPAAKKK